MNHPLGKFITFEGGEGTGKSTQLQLLAEWLRQKGLTVTATKEPGGTEVGRELRQILCCGDKDKIDPVAESLLYYADRRIHLSQKIWPALQRGEWVLSDRFADSTMAYQFYGYNQRVPRQVLTDLYQIAVGAFQPDLTLLLDLDPQIGLERSYQKANGMERKETRHESRGLEFHTNLRQGFLQMAAAEPQRFVVLSADTGIEELHRQVIRVVSERYGI